MIIKQPPIYDISHWKEIPDFNLIEPKPFLMLTKATEGTWIKDSKFVQFMAGMQQINCHRGAYHFFRKSTGGIAQAKYFCDFVRPYIDEKTVLALDMEEGGENATEILNFIMEVHNQFSNKLLWYTSKETLRTFISTAFQRDFLKSEPMWYAGYPFFPDLYNSIPSGYVDSRFPNVVLWQYSEKGQIPGIIGDVDLNWIKPDFQQELGEIPIIGATMKGTVLAGFTLTVRDSQGADTGVRLTVNDVVYGEVGAGRITFQRIYRANGTVQEQAGNAATVDPANPLKLWMSITAGSEPIAVHKTHQIDVFSDGSIHVDGNPYP